MIGFGPLFSLRESVTDRARFDPGSDFNSNYQFISSYFLSVGERRLGKTISKGVKMKAFRAAPPYQRDSFDLRFLRQEKPPRDLAPITRHDEGNGGRKQTIFDCIEGGKNINKYKQLFADYY